MSSYEKESREEKAYTQSGMSEGLKKGIMSIDSLYLLDARSFRSLDSLNEVGCEVWMNEVDISDKPSKFYGREILVAPGTTN